MGKVGPKGPEGPRGPKGDPGTCSAQVIVFRWFYFLR